MQKTVVFVTSDSPIKFHDVLTQLNPHKIGIVSHMSHGDIVDNALQQKQLTNVVAFASFEEATQALAKGKIDVLIGNKYVIHATIHLLNLTNQIKQLHPDVQDIPSYIAFSKQKDLTSVIAKFDETISSMKKDGSFQKTLEKVRTQYAKELNFNM